MSDLTQDKNNKGAVMKKIVAINASPRTQWNTSTLIRQAALGAEAEGAEVKVFDLYKLEKFKQYICKT